MEMAGLVLAAWATPEATLAIAKMAKEIASRISAYRNASALLKRLYEFGYVYNDSLFRKNVELAVALGAKTKDERLQRAVEIQTQQLYQELEKAQEIVSQMVDEDGNVHRLRYALNGERSLKKIIKNLAKYQQEFINLNTIAEATIRNMPTAQDTLLPRTSLRYISDSWENGIFQESRPHIRICDAEWKRNNDDSVEEIRVLIEEQSIAVDTDRGEIERSTQELARHLSGSFHSGGILPCLGYRNHPSLDLVFSVPDELSSPRSLQEILGEGPLDAGAPLNQRLDLARMLAQAVLSVHTAGFVHKNIRAETILLFKRQEDSSASSNFPGSPGLLPILTEWGMLRKINDPSSRRGEEDWYKNLYRHPERQGIKPETRYNMGHDIYSLGVCLLEIGLWKPLVLRQQDKLGMRSYDLSATYRNAAHTIDSSTADDKGVTKKLVKPSLVREAVLHLARQSLSPQMGDDYAEVVMSCLTCLDDARLKEVFKGDRVQAEIEFNMMVLQPLYDINI